MAAVYDGDPHPIYDIILDPNADQFVRARMCDALPMLVLQDRLDTAEAASFLRDCWMSLQPRDDCYGWNGWENAIALLGLPGAQGPRERGLRSRHHPPRLS